MKFLCFSLFVETLILILHKPLTNILFPSPQEGQLSERALD